MRRAQALGGPLGIRCDGPVAVAAFIASQRAGHGIPHAAACRALGVSRSWFYRWAGGQLPPRAARREQLKAEIHYLNNVAHFAGTATTVLALIVIGIVVAASLFFRSWRPQSESPVTEGEQPDLYSACASEIAVRFNDFYRSFETVMGAQIIISSINTALTAIFVLVVGLPHAAVVVGVTFLCGLLPIVGNLISNTIILFLAATLSLKVALAALIFLIAIHKLEYFLNSKIIGGWTRNPVWLTLIGLILGERLMGIPGLILAPVVLNYLRVEMLTVEVPVRGEDVEMLNR